ncbi:Sugar kinase of the NBD/HSP70 family, may contain an N-terminal HTH domain [Rhodoferax sp. OV413]|uniref:ROK family transcriptional regulator n=1 Tax=Rhodoferax sp. OV413 TaxID=1855285 RepID=UPI000889390E|nr:ROK family transcriptional regulator [Rhodoferax sp. OV413]SDO15380.1 Sugar kinase of the NBD/HSP70 family, may contain an N-terminal HTH domain [Rhodoferax sp. OV413]
MTPPSALSSTPPLLRPRGSNHVGMRQFNERVVLQAIRQHGSLPKAELARLTSLTAQTIGLITTRLEEDGLLIRHLPLRGRIGQPSVPLALNPDGAFSIGIKIGRRNTDWLLVDFTGQVRQRLTLAYAFPDAQTLLPALSQHLNTLRDALGPLGPRLVGIGVAAPFQMGGWHKMLGLSEAQSTDWNAIDLGAEVQAMTDLPVNFAKDVSAACVAELVSGRGRDLKTFLYLFIDTFVGGGLVINSHLHGGLHGNAGAVASLPMHLPHTPGTAPEQLVVHASLWELEQRLLAQGLDPTAAYDDRALLAPFATETHAWVAQAASALAHCVLSGTAFLDLEAVVIDGSLCRPLLELLLERTRLALADYNWEGLWRTTLVAGSIGSDARALGGALLPLHANFAPDRDLFLKA